MNSFISSVGQDKNYLILEGRHSCNVENQDFCFLELPCGEDAVRQVVETIYQYEIDIIDQLLNPEITPSGFENQVGPAAIRVWNYSGSLDLKELQLLTASPPAWSHQLAGTIIDDVASALFNIIESQRGGQTRPQLAL